MSISGPHLGVQLGDSASAMGLPALNTGRNKVADVAPSLYRLAQRWTVPYASGENPVVGEYVKNQWEQPGTVTRVHAATDGKEHISVRWDDGGEDQPLTPAKEFTLISRRA